MSRIAGALLLIITGVYIYIMYQDAQIKLIDPVPYQPIVSNL